MKNVLLLAICATMTGCSGALKSGPETRLLNQSFFLDEKQRDSLMRAAGGKDASAAYRLALYYDAYLLDEGKGSEWLLVASRLGHIEAQFVLGVRLRMSQDSIQRTEGLLWLQRSAAGGHLRARERLTLIQGGQFPQF